MANNFRILASLLIGGVIGASAVQMLHAQSKPPGFWVATIDVQDEQSYMKNFSPLTGPIFEAQGGKYLVRSLHVQTMEGPTAKRLVVVEFPSLDAAKAAYDSQAYRDARKIGDQYAKFNIWLSEGVAK